MKWYFALSEASLSDDDLYANCIRVAVLSANRNTSLRPFFLFDGGENAFVNELRSLGATVIRHRSTLYDHISTEKPDDHHFIRIASGAFLRIDIPLIEKEDEFVLYTDCDVMFLTDPDFRDLKPNYFCVAPEFTRGDYDNMNSGVMLINVPEMREIHQSFIQYLRSTKISELPAFDQGALRIHFRGIYDRLPETLNWKPYWGHNPRAEIIHFHGPKPPHAKALIDGVGDSLPTVLKDLFLMQPDYYKEAVDLWYSILTAAI